MLVCYLVAATALFGAPPREGVAALAPTALAAAERGTGRTEDLARLQSLLEQKLVAQRLADLGFSAEEIRARLEALDDQRLHEVAQRVDGLLPAGDATGGIAIGALVVFGILLVVYIVWIFGSIIYKTGKILSAPKTPTAEDAPTEGEVEPGR
jgi:hypothetical protein